MLLARLDVAQRGCDIHNSALGPDAEMQPLLRVYLREDHGFLRTENARTAPVNQGATVATPCLRPS